MERQILELLKQHLYTPEAVARLVEKVNARLRTLRPAAEAERAALQERLEWLVSRQALPAARAGEAARLILSENAARLYGLRAAP